MASVAPTDYYQNNLPFLLRTRSDFSLRNTKTLLSFFYWAAILLDPYVMPSFLLFDDHACWQRLEVARRTSMSFRC